jgi:hypothetical protein
MHDDCLDAKATCKNDADCIKNDKCCSTGSGTKCMAPYIYGKGRPTYSDESKYTNKSHKESCFWIKCGLLTPNCIRCCHFKVDDVSALEAISKPPVRIC